MYPKLIFRYGSMNSGKSMDLLKIAYNYTERNKHPIIFTHSLDDRYLTGYVTSRTGLQNEAILVYDNTSIFKEVKIFKPDIVLCDEVQFYGKHHILELVKIVDQLKIPVIAYGLKNSFKNTLFEASEYLLIYADVIEEVVTPCWFCNNNATMIIKYNENGKAIKDGRLIEIGGNEKYLPVCRKCWFQEPDWRG